MIGHPPPEPAALRRPLSELADPLGVPTLSRAFDVPVRPPGSKSITNRALLLAALAQGTSTLRGALVDADDAAVMVAALRQLGAAIEPDPADPTRIRVTGVAGKWRIAPGANVRLDLNNAGTATRFLSAAALLAPRGTTVTIDGSPRMRQRPIGELVDAMRLVGARVEYLGAQGCPPLRVHGMSGPGDVKDAQYIFASPIVVPFGKTLSGQFISAMLMAAPLLPTPVRIKVPDDATSAAYITMTRALMTRAWVECCGPDAPPTPFELDIEPDASGASYFWAAAAIIPGARCTVPGIGPGALQGDALFADALMHFGATVQHAFNATSVVGPAQLRAADIDLTDMPDTAMSAAVVALFAAPTPDNPTATSTLRGLRTLRVKETDRLAALQSELSKVGAAVEIVARGSDEALRITPPPDLLASPVCRPSPPARVEFDTYDDHRMAMALSLVGLRRANVWIRNPGCVAKSYPGYFADLARLYEP